MTSARIYLFICIAAAVILILSCPGPKSEEGANTAPFIKTAEIVPESPILGARVTLRIEAGDKEGDDISYQVKWYLNGREIGEGLEFTLENARRDDRIYAEVLPSDGKLPGTVKQTAVVKIGNTPPRILAAKIRPDTILSATGEITIIGEGFDPDGDSISFFCYWTVDGERNPDSLTTLRLAGKKLKKGSLLTAELYASDGIAVSNVYPIDIETVNSAPVLKQTTDSVVYNPQNINYQLPIVDPDGDAMTFELLDAPSTVKIDKNRGLLYGQAIGMPTIQVLVRATDGDGGYLDARFTLTAPPGQ